MKAALLTKYGKPSAFKVVDIETPKAKDDEVLVKIFASTVTAGDCGIRKMNFSLPLSFMLRLYLGFLKPRKLILGQEISGEIVEVGKDIQRFELGDEIFGTTGFKFGGYAEYITLKEKGNGIITIKPKNMTHNQAASIPTGGFEALYFLKQAKIKSGDKLLVNGAGGSIGTLVIQLGKYFGAHVTAIDNTDKLDTLLEAGADHVIDYTKEDFTRGEQTYDIIFDVIGKSHYKRSMKRLNADGSYVFSDFESKHKWQHRLSSNPKNIRVIFGGTKQSVDDLDYLKDLIEKNHLKTIIDQIMPLEEIAKAHQYVDDNLKKGNLIIQVHK